MDVQWKAYMWVTCALTTRESAPLISKFTIQFDLVEVHNNLMPMVSMPSAAKIK
jgi:hypothetical protein